MLALVVAKYGGRMVRRGMGACFVKGRAAGW